MNLRTQLALVAVLPLLSGCVVHTHSDGFSGDVAFSWTFQGYTCNQDPRIAFVHIDIPGETLQNQGSVNVDPTRNDGDYDCTIDGADGVTLHNFLPGTYDFKVTAFDINGVAIYGPAAGTFDVNGNVNVPVDLAAVGGPVAPVFYNWSFAAHPGGVSNNPLCADAIPGVAGGLTTVLVSVDGAPQYAVNCADGQTSQGAFLGVLPQGSHTVDLVATDSGGWPHGYQQFTGTIPVTGTVDQVFDAPMDWTVGSTAFTYHLYEGNTEVDCSLAPSVFVNFFDRSTQQWLYPTPGSAFACSNTDRTITYPYLPAGTLDLQVTAGTTANPGIYVYIDTNSGTLPVNIAAGQFPTVPFDVNLDRVQ